MGRWLSQSPRNCLLIYIHAAPGRLYQGREACSIIIFALAIEFERMCEFMYRFAHFPTHGRERVRAHPMSAINRLMNHAHFFLWHLGGISQLGNLLPLLVLLKPLADWSK